MMPANFSQCFTWHIGKVSYTFKQTGNIALLHHYACFFCYRFGTPACAICNHRCTTGLSLKIYSGIIVLPSRIDKCCGS